MTRDELKAALEALSETPQFPTLIMPLSPQAALQLLDIEFRAPSGKVSRIVGGRLDGMVIEPWFQTEESA